MSTDPEVERLAQQRRDDLTSQRERELAAATLAGRREAERAQESAEIKRQFAALNVAIAQNSTALQQLTDEVHEIKEEQARRDAVNEALITSAAGQGTKQLNRYQILGIVVMALIALASLIVAIIQAATAG